jgi:hypothetical protein
VRTCKEISRTVLPAGVALHFLVGNNISIALDYGGSALVGSKFGFAPPTWVQLALRVLSRYE